MHPVLGLRYGDFTKFTRFRRIVFLISVLCFACGGGLLAALFKVSENAVAGVILVSVILVPTEKLLGHALKTIMPSGPRGS
jgi:hypothetical protein